MKKAMVAGLFGLAISVPVTPTLLPWLEVPVGPSDRYVSHRKKPIGSILHMWRLTREAAGLDERVTPYSIRHGMARELRKRRVPTEQIKLFLGHQRPRIRRINYFGALSRPASRHGSCRPPEISAGPSAERPGHWPTAAERQR